MKLKSRLGNQLFQFAFGRALAARNGGTVAYLPEWNAKGCKLTDVVHRGYREPTLGELLKVLAIDGRGLERRHATHYVIERALHRTRNTLQHHANWPQSVYESARAFDPSLLSTRGPALVKGYFQSEMYFADVADEIDSVIALPSVEEFCDRLHRPVLSLSFRRGDFATIGALLPLRYYETALALVRERVDFATIVVISDDRDFALLAKEYFAASASLVVVTDPAGDDLADLAVMAAADHNIIANSTFAWWGAWLAERRVNSQEHLVVAPSRWQHGRLDVIPDRWLTVETAIGSLLQ